MRSDGVPEVEAPSMTITENGVAKVKAADVLKTAEAREQLAAVARLRTAGVPEVEAPRCPACNGNDADAPCAFPEGGQPGCLRDKRIAAPERLWLEVADVLRIVDANESRQEIERALIANLPSNGGPRPRSVAVPIPQGECLAPHCHCDPGTCYQRDPAAFTPSVKEGP